jgi:Ca-activated chloride channel family protein
MLTLAHPWLLLLLPAGLVLGWFLPAYRESREALRVPFMAKLTALTGRKAEGGAVVPTISPVQKVQIILCWSLLVVAMARPQWIGEPMVKNTPMRDLMLSVDLSGSMETKDFTDEQGRTVDRLTAVKQVLDDFLSRRDGDRVGLIFFGTAPFLQVPFTEDLEVCRTLLGEAQVRMAGPKTAVGDSIGLAIHLFENSDVEKRLLILLTDGNDTASQVLPEDAARIAADKGIVIHTVAVGDPLAVGEQALDEEVLKNVAATTGGRFFRANDRDELVTIYDELDALETREVETVTHRPRFDLYFWPLAAALLLNGLFHVFHALSYARLETSSGRLDHA